MASTAVQAASWALACQIASVWPGRVTIAETHPGGGQYDCLTVVPPDALSGADTVKVFLNREGTAQVAVPDRDHIRIGTAALWDDIAQGRGGVADLADEVLRVLGYTPEPPHGGVDLLCCRLLATVLAQAALYGVRWSVRSAAMDSSLGSGVEQHLLESFQEHLPRPVGSISFDDARRYWVVIDEAGQPLWCVDTEGRVLQADGGEPSDLTGYGDDVSQSQAIATSLIAQRLGVALHDQGAASTRPGLGLASALSAFNRKERFFLMTQAAGLVQSEIHGQSIPLSKPFRERLGAALGLLVPRHAYAAIDFHLSWLHAALAWWQGKAWPMQQSDFPQTTSEAGAAWVTGSAEDVDLLVCWADGDTQHVVAVEAKAYGSWDNAQVASKMSRLEAIRDQRGAEVDLRLVLTSRRPPQKLAGPPPAWASDPDGAWSWMPLSAPGLRLKSMRCNIAGKSDSEGQQWRITGPASR